MKVMNPMVESIQKPSTKTNPKQFDMSVSGFRTKLIAKTKSWESKGRSTVVVNNPLRKPYFRGVSRGIGGRYP